MTAHPQVGLGIYSPSEAARLIRLRHGVSARRLHSWSKRHSTFGEHPSPEGGSYLTFVDLVSLEIVTRLREQKVTSQRIRRTESDLRREFPNVMHPFAAVGIFYTDGQNLWAALDDDGRDVVEVIGRRPRHMVMSQFIRPFVEEIHVGKDNMTAARWQVTPFVEIDPEVQFGKPVVAGTRVTVRTVLANLEAGSPAEVADWYGLTVEQVQGVQAFASAA